MENSDKLEWIHPDKVMEIHRVKEKKKALQARMNRSQFKNTTTLFTPSSQLHNDAKFTNNLPPKRKNPFLKNESIKKLKESNLLELDASSDSTLFDLLNLKPSEITMATNHNKERKFSFASVLTKLDSPDSIPEREVLKGEKNIPMDWTLHTKLRLMSENAFDWNVKLKTSEEASSTTGFVRCLDIGEKETTLDTSPNARFHRHCLIWQHPSLPWLELYPRTVDKATSSMFNNSTVASNQTMKDALYKEWSESFRSLYHLLRARQCPYFYVCANPFTALFRAAGICGLSELHALLTPTTRGFRQALKQEGIEYTMPLRNNSQLGHEISDSTVGKVEFFAYNVTTLPHQKKKFDEEAETEEKWLQSLGVEESEIRKIHNLQTRLALEKECEQDSEKQSLIFVIGIEAQALFNFLINCKSATTTVGTMAGIPPTLLAPVAFNGATLKSLKVRESEVLIDNKKFHSLELKGPLLPHVLPSLCSLMKSRERQYFSVSCAQLLATTSFSKAKHGQGGAEPREARKLPQSVFGQENLTDCGFSKELLEHFCNPDPARIQVLENLKFSNDVYSWT
ncbi:protein downstream neighbor of son homolog [Belonocnema kinseyi]|uniref:protein downstream neighbor of son homolog n=1 Tax=Belonocnema kinseyi TaxID=2817044 RepID=UPI00143D6D19|nr:protein downstream neighbor of son homolog [Belonocnema kinseyi]XP_033230990.1 protein downstream neighbor of son homolog [Belonocnema kinseyi]XP_033230991.1 protein downstream neighbor of son homolog [Belonocnema kinseyi]